MAVYAVTIDTDAIGMELSGKTEHVVARVKPGSAAEREGVTVGSELIAVEKQGLRGRLHDDVTKLLKLTRRPMRLRFRAARTEEERKRDEEAMAVERARLEGVKQTLAKTDAESLIGWRIALVLQREMGAAGRKEAVVADTKRVRGSATQHVVRYDTGELAELTINWKALQNKYGARTEYDLLRKVEPGPSRRGILRKQAMSGKNNWKKRYFTLCGYTGRLSYFEPGRDGGAGGKLKGSFTLSDRSLNAVVNTFQERGEPNPCKQPHCFKLQLGTTEGLQTLVMSANSEAIMLKWVQVLRDALGHWIGAESKGSSGRPEKKSEEDTQTAQEKWEMLGQPGGAASVADSKEEDDVDPKALSAEETALLAQVASIQEELTGLLREGHRLLYDRVWQVTEIMEAAKEDVADLLRACRNGSGRGDEESLGKTYVEVCYLVDDAFNWLEQNEGKAPSVADVT
eukprot:g4914.t1